MNSNDLLKIPDPIRWRQGMLLSPQHFQQQHLHVEKLISHKYSVAQPNFWGIIDIDISESDLINGTVRVTRLHAVLPDGEVIDFRTGDEDDSEALSLTISTKKTPKLDEHSAILISVGVVRRDAKLNGVVGKVEKRYATVQNTNVVDENNIDQIINLERKKLIPKLFASNEISSRYTTLPLFKLIKYTDDTFKISDYHPPMLDLKVSKKIFESRTEASLSEQLESLVSNMRGKARRLASNRSLNSSASSYSTISALMSKLPTMELLLRSPLSHPFQVYLNFVDMVSGIMTLNPAAYGESKADFFSFIDYKHDDPAPGFRHIKILNEIVNSIQLDYESRRFTAIGDGEFEIDLSEKQDTSEIFIELAVENSHNPKLLQDWFDKSVIGSAGAIGILELHRLPGAKRKAVSASVRHKRSLPARGYIMSLGNEIYDHKKGKFNSISAGKKLTIKGKSENAPTAIYLYEKGNEDSPED